MPALIVSEFVGNAKSTDSLAVESIRIFKSPTSVMSDNVIVSAPPLNVNTRSATTRSSVTGSRPV